MLFNIPRLLNSVAGLIIGIGILIVWFDAPIQEIYTSLVKISVLIGGFLNAYGLAHQTYQLWKAGKSDGHSMQMYGLFLFIQVSLALNGIQHQDWFQTSGMIASMVPTIWTMALIRRFSLNPRS